MAVFAWRGTSCRCDSLAGTVAVMGGRGWRRCILKMIKLTVRTRYYTVVIVSWERAEGGGTWRVVLVEGHIFYNFVFLVYFRGG